MVSRALVKSPRLPLLLSLPLPHPSSSPSPFPVVGLGEVAMDGFEEEAPLVVVAHSGSAAATRSGAGNTTITSAGDAAGQSSSSERTKHVDISGSEDVNAQCDYVKWLDDEWPERVQDDLKEMWRELRIAKHNETKFGDRLAEAVEAHVETMDDKASLEKEIAETREMAGRRVEVYKKMAEDYSGDRMKFLNMRLFLGAVIIAILCAIIIMK